MDNSILKEKHQLLISDFTPNYNQIFIHPEEGKDFRINNAFEEIKTDIENINDILTEKSNLVSLLLTNTVNRLDLVNKKILKEEERLQDLKMLCNKYTDFDKVINITDKNITGKCNYYNDTFSSYIESYRNSPIYIESIVGNGLEGNRYVYKDYNYVEDSLNTSNRNALVDNKISTYWEYQRITASSKEDFVIHDFNIDSEEAKCTLTLFSQTKINQLEIKTDSETNKIINLQYSDNGIDYEDITLPYISLNKKTDSYDNVGYIYGSNLISIPNAFYVKITLQSNATTNDVLAYEKTLFKDEIFDKEEINEIVKETTIVQSAKRHVIKINDIKAYYNKYSRDSYFKTDNLVKDDKIYAVGVFANTYIPENITTDTIEFILTVNGVDYKVLPVNSESNGTKIIRFSKGKSNLSYTEYTDEVITSVILTIKLKSYKEITPYLNNIKVLLGGEQ